MYSYVDKMDILPVCDAVAEEDNMTQIVTAPRLICSYNEPLYYIDKNAQ